MKASLILLPVPLFEHNQHFVTKEYLENLTNCDVLVCERIRTARRWISSLKAGKAIDDYTWLELPKQNSNEIIGDVKKAWNNNLQVGLLSESGTPCIADPGHALVKIAHRSSIHIKPLVGPNSIILALMASGFNGQNFTFHGYLPIKTPQLQQALQTLDRSASKLKSTQIFIETPYRNDRLVEHILKYCNPEMNLCIAKNLTSPEESIQTKSIREWKKTTPVLGKAFCIFLLGYS